MTCCDCGWYHSGTSDFRTISGDLGPFPLERQKFATLSLGD